MTTVLPVGTKENIVVDITDRIGSISTLDGSNPTFDVRKRGAGSTWKLQAQPVTNIGMRAYCLVDTDTWEVGTYELFINFQALPEEPRVGPLEFEVAHA